MNHPLLLRSIIYWYDCSWMGLSRPVLVSMARDFLECNAPQRALHPAFGQANERGAVPELAGGVQSSGPVVRRGARCDGYLGAHARTRTPDRYHLHWLQTAIVATVAGQQQHTCRDKQHWIARRRCPCHVAGPYATMPLRLSG